MPEQRLLRWWQDRPPQAQAAKGRPPRHRQQGWEGRGGQNRNQVPLVSERKASEDMIPRRVFTQREKACRKGCLLEGPGIVQSLHPSIKGGGGNVGVRATTHATLIIRVGVRLGRMHTGLERSKTVAEEVQCYHDTGQTMGTKVRDAVEQWPLAWI